MLIIEAREEAYKGYRYTSSRLKTQGLYFFTYGRVEASIKIPSGHGIWPAFWMLGDDISTRGWSGCGEIDIMEYYQGRLLANVAWLGTRPGEPAWDSFRRPIEEFGDPDWSRKFHVWRMDWSAESIRLYVDELLLNTTDLTGTVNGDSEGANPFHEPHYMLLNLAIGGESGGDPSKTDFPSRFEVDYVRVNGHLRRL